MLYHHLQEVQIIAEQAETLVHLCHKKQFGYLWAMGTILQGWVLARQGEIELGITQMHQSLVEFQAARARFILPFFLALLAELSEEAGNREQGFILLDEAWAAVNKNDERWYEAEVIRLKGILLLKTQEKARAEAHFHQAIEIARRQRTKSLELRATMSLCRLWRGQGKKEEARSLLSEI